MDFATSITSLGLLGTCIVLIFLPFGLFVSHVAFGAAQWRSTSEERREPEPVRGTIGEVEAQVHDRLYPSRFSGFKRRGAGNTTGTTTGSRRRAWLPNK